MSGAPVHHRGHLWRAEGLAAALDQEFRAAVASGDDRAARRAFFVMARYSRRTLGILRSAAHTGDDELAAAAVANLAALHGVAGSMRQAAPELTPDPILLTHAARDHALDDLVVETLDAVHHPLSSHRLAARLAGGGRDNADTERAIQPHLAALERTGHLHRDGQGRWARTARGHRGVDRDRIGLAVLVGPAVQAELAGSGVHGLRDLAARPPDSARAVADATGWSRPTAEALVSLATDLSDELRSSGPVRPADLLHAPHVRTYQHEAHARLRQGGYRGLVVDAPAGSGKTLIGLLCLADWLPAMAPGQSVLILAPNLSVVQQWVRELCFSPLGLRLAPHLVATSLGAGHGRRRTDPPVVVLTYAALAAVGSGHGKGGFDRDGVERLLQGWDVQYVVLDEVHKVVEEPRSTVGEAIRVLSGWLADGSLRGIVGLSATAALHRDRLARMGLDVAWEVAEAELVRSGFVAPSGSVTVPVTRSEREERLRALASGYRRELRLLLTGIGSDRLRRWFAAVPRDQRLDLARHALRLPAGGPDGEGRLVARFEAWTTPGPLRAHELPLVWLLQLATGWTDRDLLARAAAEAAAAGDGGAVGAGIAPGDGGGEPELVPLGRERLDRLAVLRAELAGLAARPDVRPRLAAGELGGPLDPAARAVATAPGEHPAARFAAARTALAGTAAGVVASLHDEARASGEGRVAAVRTILAAERRVRPVPVAVVFERGGALVRPPQPATPGWTGVAGLFAALLDDPTCTPMAVLPDELYLPHRANGELAAAVAHLVRERVVVSDLGRQLHELATTGLRIGDEHRRDLQDEIVARLRPAVAGARPVGGPPAPALERTVLQPLRRFVRQAGLGGDGVLVGERLAPSNPRVRDWVALVSAYAAVAAAFDVPELVTVRGGGGGEAPVDIVRLPGGQRRSIAFDVVARVVDAGLASAPLIDVVVVSSWARTGWDVHAPNLLIDATGTSDPIAWRQLRGRVLRPWPGPAPAGGKVSHLYALVPAVGLRSGTRPARDPRAHDAPLLDGPLPPRPSPADLAAGLARGLAGADVRLARL